MIYFYSTFINWVNHTVIFCFSNVRTQQKKNQYSQSCSYIMRKVWYHQIWIQNYIFRFHCARSNVHACWCITIIFSNPFCISSIMLFWMDDSKMVVKQNMLILVDNMYIPSNFVMFNWMKNYYLKLWYIGYLQEAKDKSAVRQYETL